MNILGLLTTHHKILIVLEVFYQGEEKSRELFFSRLVLVRQGRFLVIFSLEIGMDFLRTGGGHTTRTHKHKKTPTTKPITPY